MFSFYYNSILKDVFGIVVKTYLYEHTFIQMCCQIYLTLISSHLSINREGRWGATDDFATSFLHFFPVLHCPLGHVEFQACPFDPDVAVPPLPLSALSFPVCHCALQDGFGQT